jgi:type IV secretory pathway VirB3-like protein
MDGFRDPIFTGCTRPAMLGGVPIVPLILIGGLTLLVSVWLYYLVSGYVSLGLVLSAIPSYCGCARRRRRTISACAK